jgi:hypothetical protein
MKTNYVPAIVMLLAGAVYCLFGIRAGVPLMDFTVQLLIVLLIFYVLGVIVRLVLDKFMGDIGVKTDTEEDAESAEDATTEDKVEEKERAEASEVEEE